MKRPILQLAVICSLAFTLNSLATVHYVDVNSTNAISPFLDWSTAAINIQDAIDSAIPGDQILVTNGVYQTGSRVIYGAMTNRVAITKAVLVQSVNGPAVTTIQGGGSAYSDSAIRCVYLTNGASLSGFTISGGSTRAVSWPTATPENCGGGLWCESVSATISNCVLVGNSAYFDGGGAYGGAFDHCTLTNNNSSGGGGAAAGTLTNCTLIGNSASVGGGAYQCVLDNCTIQQNSSVSGGGGALECTLTHCTLLNNTTGGYGGGANNGTLTNCTITGNTAGVLGGGAAGGGAGQLHAGQQHGQRHRFRQLQHRRRRSLQCHSDQLPDFRQQGDQQFIGKQKNIRRWSIRRRFEQLRIIRQFLLGRRQRSL